jgi:gas vesicle protein
MSTHDALTPAAGSRDEDDPEKLRADIERTRAQMSETIGAIQDKWQPEELKHQAVQQLNEVKEKLKEELREQLDELKGKVKEEIRDAKDKLREATVGKVEHMVHNATDTVEHARDSIFETVRANPIPAAMVGIGIAWLLVRRRDARALPRADYRYVDRRFAGGYPYAGEMASANYDPRYERDDERSRLGRLQERTGEVAHRVQDAVGGAVQHASERTREVAHQVSDRTREVAHQVSDRTREVAHQVGDRTREVAHQVGDRAKEVAHQVQETASDLAVRARGTADDLAERTRYGVRRAEDRLQTTYETNPLALGVVAVLAGVAVGLALPRTRREDRLMGQSRNELLRRAQRVAHEAIEKVQGAVGEATHSNGVRDNRANYLGSNSI